MLRKYTFWGFLGIVATCPLPLGANRPLAWSFLAVLVGMALVAWAVENVAAGRRPPVSPSRLWPVIGLFFLAAGWAAVQAMPIPVIHWIHPLRMAAAAVLSLPVEATISLAPAETVSSLMRLLTYGGVFWLALQYTRSTGRAMTVFVTVIVAGMAFAAYGLFVQFTGVQKILWFDKWAYHTDLTSTFVNRNSYATYAGLGLVCTLGLLIKTAYANVYTGPERRRFFRLFLANLAERSWPLILASVIIATALLGSHSRGGLFSAIAGILALLATAAWSRSIKPRHVLASGIAVGIAGIAILALSGHDTNARMERLTLAAEDRDEVFALTARAVGDAPWTGTGYGTFESVFRVYRDDTIRGTGVWDKAHNTYLETALELGIPAAGCLTVAVAGLAVLCLVGARRRKRNAIFPAIGVAVTVQVAVNSLFDFSLQIPAVAVTYAAIMGAACAQSWSTVQRHDTPAEDAADGPDITETASAR